MIVLADLAAGESLRVAKSVAYRLLEGSVLVIHHRGEELRIVAGGAVWRPEPEALPRAA